MPWQRPTGTLHRRGVHCSWPGVRHANYNQDQHQQGALHTAHRAAKNAAFVAAFHPLTDDNAAVLVILHRIFPKVLRDAGNEPGATRLLDQPEARVSPEEGRSMAAAAAQTRVGSLQSYPNQFLRTRQKERWVPSSVNREETVGS